MSAISEILSRSSAFKPYRTTSSNSLMDLVGKLSKLLGDSPKSIELIPGDGQEWLEQYPDNPYTPFLLVEGNLGVPEKVLYMAYLDAVKRLDDLRACRKRIISGELDDAMDALSVTSVIILANPAHQTALNIRKDAVIALIRASSTPEIFPAELRFLAALLCMNHCAKVSMLWHYRRFLLATIHKHTFINADLVVGEKMELGEGDCEDIFFQKDFTIDMDVLNGELDLADRSSKVYPWNYFAWYHRFLCFKAGTTAYVKLMPCFDGVTGPKSEKARTVLTDLGNALETELRSAMRFLRNHISDLSAVNYICKVHEELHKAARSERGPGDDDNPVKLQSSVSVGLTLLNDAIELVQTYPSSGPLWHYLRCSIAILIRNHRQNPDKIVQRQLSRADLVVRQALKDAKKQCSTIQNAEAASEQVRKSVHLIPRHALRYCLWRCRNRIDCTPESEDPNDAFDKYAFTELACSHFTDAFQAVSRQINSEDLAVALLRAVSSVE